MLEKKLRICFVSNSSSEFGYHFSGLDTDMIFMNCISPKDIPKISKKSDPDFIPEDSKEKLFVFPLTAKEYVILGRPSIGAELSVKISQLAEAI